MATKEELQRAAQRAARAGDRESARELAEAARKASQELMDYELMQDVFNRVPVEARPGGKYGLISGFGYGGDYPTKGRVTTPKQFGQKLPGESSPSIRTSGNSRVAGFYNTPDFDPRRDPINRDKGLFPLGNFPEGDDVYYQDILFPKQYGRVINRPDQTIMHEFFHRGATMLPLYDLRRYAWDKGDRDTWDVFTKMISFRDGGEGQEYLLEAIDAYVEAKGDENKIPSHLRSRLDKIEKANEVIREFMTPEKQKELGLRMPLRESKPKKKEGMFTGALKNKKEDPSMYRRDGSKKSARGFLGPVKNKVEGGTMTEVSVGMEINGKEMEVPTMVPTLTKQEIETLSNMKLEGNAKNIPKSIIMKAKQHALQRIEQGLSPFYQDGEEKGAEAP